jgi:hypothetical protein
LESRSRHKSSWRSVTRQHLEPPELPSLQIPWAASVAHQSAPPVNPRSIFVRS